MWDDVPEGERVTEDMLLNRAMSENDGWVERQLNRQAEPGCQAAVPYAPWDKSYRGVWQPCGMSPMPGEMFCAKHGGRKREPKNAIDQELTRLKRRRERAQREADALLRLCVELDGMIARLSSG